MRQTINAKEQTESATESERINLAVMSARLENLSTNSLTKELESNGFTVILSGNDINFKVINSGWVVEGKYEKYYITTDGDINVVADRTGLKVGDYIKYTYDIKDSDYLLEGKYSGYTITDSDGNKTYKNQAIKQVPDLTWQVFNINEDTGEILLISSTSKNLISFQGALGYNNAVYFMNDICKELYSNKTLGVKARSINLDDVTEVMNSTGKEKMANMTIKSTFFASYSANRYYPDIYQYELSSGIDSQTVLKNGIDRSETYKRYNNGLTTNSYSMATNFLNATKTLVYGGTSPEWYSTDVYADGLANPVYDLIFNCNFSLATRCVSFNNGNYADFRHTENYQFTINYLQCIFFIKW